LFKFNLCFVLNTKQQNYNYIFISNKKKANRSKKLKNKSTTTQNEEDELNIKQNETIQRIEELLSTLTTTTTNSETDNLSIDTTSSSISNASSSNANSILPATATYAELLAMYEKEKLACLDMETNFQHKAKESSKQIETLNQEMNNLSTIIDDLRQQYLKMQVQYQYQVDSLIKLNENLRADLQQSEYVNSLFKAENLKLKAEIKQFQGEQTMLLKDFDQQYHPTQSIDEANRQLNQLRTELVRMYQANQSLHRQHNISLESIKQLQKSNLHLQRGGSNNNNNNNNTTNSTNTTSSTQDDHTVMMQSLESELERERKVRTEAENDLTDMKQQLKQIKDKSHSIVDSLRQKCEQNEFELRKFKEDNMELTNQIQSLKKESNNSLSVQEDLVRLIQSLQIELSQMKQASEVGGGAGVSGTTATETNMIVVRCQDEIDFNNCANCTNQFSSAKKKQRCKHCCKIFCNDCCAKTVLSGPNLRYSFRL
jgi:DNA repair exonuclease SbcCD ATPase subunit